MPRLYRTTCSTDWKLRPMHSLTALGAGTVEELVAMQDADVAVWQAEDLENDWEAAKETAIEDGEPPPAEKPTVWPMRDERWEMNRKGDEKLRTFAGGGDGDSWSIAYHILDVEGRRP